MYFKNLCIGVIICALLSPRRSLCIAPKILIINFLLILSLELSIRTIMLMHILTTTLFHTIPLSLMCTLWNILILILLWVIHLFLIHECLNMFNQVLHVLYGWIWGTLLVTKLVGMWSGMHLKWNVLEVGCALVFPTLCSMEWRGLKVVHILFLYTLVCYTLGDIA